MNDLQLYAEITSLSSNLKKEVSAFVKSLKQKAKKKSYNVFEEPLTAYKPSLLALLLKGPIFSKAQINKITETRDSINEWRTR